MTKSRIRCLAAVLCLTGLLCCGCMFVASPEELYQLPRPTSEHTELKEQLEAIAAGGAESISPTHGNNLQAVQMVDLNGDGSEEAVAFFSNTSDEKPLKIYVFTKRNGVYERAALLENGGSSIYHIFYEDMNGDGCREILVGWRSNAEVLSLSVYNMHGFKPQQVLSVRYNRVVVSDVNGDGKCELVVVREDSEQESTVADYYTYAPEGMTLQNSCRLSAPVSELARLTEGQLDKQVVAIFASALSPGNKLMVDILSVQEDKLRNLTVNSSTGITDAIFDYSNLYPQDINRDGITEVPQTERYVTQSSNQISTYVLVNWLQYDSSGAARSVLTTYFDVSGSWYLEIPEALKNSLYLESISISNEYSVHFYEQYSGEQQEILAIYALQGDDREEQMRLRGLTPLEEMPDTLYAFSVEPNGYYSGEDAVRKTFRLVSAGWTTERN